MAEADNKFPFTSPLGDTSPYHGTDIPNGNKGDVAHDSAGVPNVDQHEQTDMDMALEPNKFPRETGHDSLTEEEAQLS